MDGLAPVSRRELVARLARLGFNGPYGGGKHQYMRRGDRVVRIPNPHRGAVGVELLTRVLRQAGIGRDEWLGG